MIEMSPKFRKTQKLIKKDEKWFKLPTACDVISRKLVVMCFQLYLNVSLVSIKIFHFDFTEIISLFKVLSRAFRRIQILFAVGINNTGESRSYIQAKRKAKLMLRLRPPIAKKQKVQRHFSIVKFGQCLCAWL